jgi:hypothetical protein
MATAARPSRRRFDAILARRRAAGHRPRIRNADRLRAKARTLRTEASMAMIRHPKDFIAGLLFVAFGIGAIVVAANYPLGTAARMGPGYFPRMLGILLVVLGAALALRALRLRGAPLPAWPWRPTVIALGSVVLFGAIINQIGLAVSTVILIVLASAASHEFRPKEALISGILLAALAIAVFVVGLKLQLPIWPAFIPR